MADTIKYKYLDENGLLYLWTLLKSKLSGKVDNNSFTTEISELKKVDGEHNNSIKEIISNIESLATAKQDKLVAGTHITINAENVVDTLPHTLIKYNINDRAFKSIEYDTSSGNFIYRDYDGAGSPPKDNKYIIANSNDLNGKVDKVTGMGLSQNSYTTDEKTKLSALPDNATLVSTYAKKSDITTLYRHKGSVTFASLPLPSNCSVGDVYNIKDSFSTSEYFVEGRGKSYPAGSNVSCVEDNGTKLWDVLGGQIDLSPFAKAEEFAAITNTEIDNVLAN